MEMTEKRRGKDGRRAETTAAGGRSGGLREKGRGERGRRGRREEPESWKLVASEEERLEESEEVDLEREGGMERWGRGRRLLSIPEDEERKEPSLPEPTVSVSFSTSPQQPSIQTTTTNTNNNNNNNNNNNPYSYNPIREFLLEEEWSSSSSSFSTVHQQRRPPRSLLSSTLQPPLSTLSFLYPFGEEHTLLPQPVPLSLRRGTAILSPPLTPLLSSTSSSSSSSPLLSARATMNDFARKVEGFWILRELQSWLWRSAKDFNRLKKRLRG